MCTESCKIESEHLCAKRRKIHSNEAQCSVVHSGQFMSSRVHDPDDVYSVPLPSPDVNRQAVTSVTEEELGTTYGKQISSDKTKIGFKRRKHVVSPKWKNFSGCGLEWLSKIRLNNVIWRTWYHQSVRISKFSMICLSPNMPNSNQYDVNNQLEFQDKQKHSTPKQYSEWRKTCKSTKSCDTKEYKKTNARDSQNSNERTEIKDKFTGLWSYTSAYQVDYPDTLFSSYWDLEALEMTPVSYLNSESYQPIMGQMYTEFNFNYLDSVTDDDLININSTQNGENKFLQSYDPYSIVNPTYLNPSIETEFDTNPQFDIVSTQNFSPPNVQDIFSSGTNQECKQPNCSANFYDKDFLSSNLDQPENYSNKGLDTSDTNYLLPPHSTIFCVPKRSENKEQSYNDEEFSSGHTSSSSLRKSSCMHTSAEEHRRHLIKMGFLKLESLIPPNLTNVRKSRAAILQKASEYIHRIQEDNNRQRNSIQLLQNQINILQSKVVELQNQLPECGISPSRKAGNFNDSQNPKLLCEFMKKKTSENWVFYIFSLIIMPMYQTFQATVNCNSTNHEFLEKIRQWKETNCRLSNFRSSE
ncbi:hypothetical protein GJ496_004285 [Pomphorhynchus laevis]|nr:hypothetical protein GJ496_004285 [Pomphorhynchus laevis]